MDDKTNSAKDKQDQENEQIVDVESVQEQAEEPQKQEAMQIDYLDQLKRLQAEFINYKRRVAQQQAECFNLAVSDTLKQLLPVVDDFEQFFGHYSREGDSDSVRAAGLIYDKLSKILDEIGLEILSKDENSCFNPELHEAVSIQKTADQPDGKILQVWQRGYKFKDKLIRPAKVIVAQNTESKKLTE
jgi:molecular chaperone GrpE